MAVTDNLEDFFEEIEEEFLRFERISNPKSPRSDLHAFLLLDELVPGTGKIISDAQHDEFWLSVSVDELLAVATRDQLIDLHRCGVRCSEDSLCMFS